MDGGERPVRLLLANAHGSDHTVGGAEMYVSRLAEGMPDHGFEILFLSAFPERVPPAAPTWTLYRTHWRDSQIRRRRNQIDQAIAWPGRHLDRAIAWARPDLVHTHNLPGLTTGLWEICRRRDIPVVHTLHDYNLLCPRVTLMRPDGEECRPNPALCGLRTRSMRRWSPGVGDVIGVSHHVLQKHAGFFPAARTHVLRHPFPAAGEPPPPPRERLTTLGYLGALERTKGVDRLLTLAPELERMGIRLLIAGNGLLRPEVEAVAAREPAIQYEGVVGGERKAAFVAACDAGILPSVWGEPGGPPFAVLEWLAAGRPMLMSASGGLGEAFPVLGGTVRMDPSPEGILAAVRRLAEPDVWREALDGVAAISIEDGNRDWLATHAGIYRGALGAVRATDRHRAGAAS